MQKVLRDSGGVIQKHTYFSCVFYLFESCFSKNVDISEKNLEENSNLDPKTETLAEAN